MISRLRFGCTGLNVTLHKLGEHNTGRYNLSWFITEKVENRLLLIPNMKAFSGYVDNGPRH